MNKEFTEVFFYWTCPLPDCLHSQQDSVNAAQGPYLSLTCGKCGQAFGPCDLDPADARAWDTALTQADNLSKGL